MRAGRGALPAGVLAALRLAVAVGLAGAACAEERAPINRVQANALAKSFFVGPDLHGTADDPEFWKRGTIVDVAYGAAQDGLFTSSYGEPLSRVRWEITEESLNARLSYERVTGTDGKGTQQSGVQPKAANDGQIVASYKIASHFDIAKDYNPQTGETLNIVEENTTDRPWSERAYFRVDWSKNLVSAAYDYDLLALLSAVGGVRYEPFAYTALDPADPNAPVFDAAAGYFDVTNKVYAVPQVVDLASLGAGTGTVPACLLPSAYVTGGGYPAADCNPVELTVRESFRRVVDTDYEPMDFDGVRAQAMGAFNLNFRRGYTRNYGLLDREWSRFLSRYNLWSQSHYYADPANPDPAARGAIACATKATTEDPTGDPGADPNRDLDGDGTADECAGAGSGARCDVFTRKCTLPYRARTVRTIPWYVAGDTSLFEPTNWAALEWDLALRTAVQTARLVECRKTGAAGCDAAYPMWRGQQDDNDEAVRIARSVDGCRRARGWDAQECRDLATTAAGALAAQRAVAGGGDGDGDGTRAIGAIAAMPPVIVLCHNPVVAGDHPACGAAGLTARTGDLRYNVILSVPGAQTRSPWGIMVDADDPLTGEKIAASVNVWTATTDRAAQALVDIVRYVNGELSTEQITNGSYVRDWAAAARLSARGGLPTMGAGEIARRLASGGALDVDAFRALSSSPPAAALRRVVAAGKDAALDVQARNDLPSPAQARLDATLAQARGSSVEAQLINPAILQLAGLGPGASGASAQVSPLGFNNPLRARRLRALRENALAARGACVIDQAPEPSSLTGLAEVLAAKFPAAAGETPAARQGRYDRMFQYVRRRYHYSVVAHEMGHSIGLRHNFAGSAASLFYRPQYWQLRTRNGQVQAACADAAADGAACVGPRYWDPVTDEERSNLIWMWGQSTVMDYAGDTTQNLLGLGAFDFAAVRFFYGDSVSVYASPAYAAGTSIGTGISAATDSFGGLLGLRYGLRSVSPGEGVDDFHYAQLQQSYQVITACQESTPAPPDDWDASVDGVWSPLLDGHVVSVDGRPTRCRQQPVDYAGYTQLRAPTAAELNGATYRGGPSVDPAGRTRVPYVFGADNWADIGNLAVFRDDSGADPYEQVQFLVSTQENRHVFDDYRRGRTTFSLPAVTSYAFDRYSSKLQAIASGAGFLASIYGDVGTNQGYSFKTLWPLLASTQLRDSVVAATVVFDQLTRELARPEPGRHYRRSPLFSDPVLHSASDPDDLGPDETMLGQTDVVIPNGTTGYLMDVGFGGHLLENALSSDHGDYDVEYIQNAGSYYDKINTAILFSQSEDRFVSQSRRDFYDARFRSAGLADLLPQGFRRVIGNALTGDRSILAPRVEADSQGTPLLDAGASTARDPLANLYPARPLGWVSLWPTGGAEICFPTGGRDACTNYAGDGGLASAAPASMAPVDPQIGWEVQKFLIVWTLAYVKANQKTAWTDMMRIWRLGQNAAPEIEPRVEWQDPTSGETYYARAVGTECLFGDPARACAGGQVVQQGIAARVLEYANRLTARGYELDVAGYPAAAGRPAGYNAFGRAMVARQPGGAPVVRADPAVRDVTPAGGLTPTVGCNQNVVPACVPLTPDQNHWARELQSYKSVPDYLWQVEAQLGWINAAGPLGVY